MGERRRVNKMPRIVVVFAHAEANRKAKLNLAQVREAVTKAIAEIQVSGFPLFKENEFAVNVEF